VNGFDMRPQHLREDYGKYVHLDLYSDAKPALLSLKNLKRAILSHGSTECVDWADPILQPPLRIENGMAIPSDRPGNGFAWDADVVAKYRLD
jgi:L-alanine-DL-glutamate epimerase-like enolase superfamily enzyme